MAEYYYTVATLPTLQRGSDPQISVEYFLETCSYTISEEDYNTLCKASLIPENVETGSEAVKKWNIWENTLRNELARLRSQTTGIDAEKYIVETESAAGLSEIARSAVNAANPKAGEDILDDARWKFLEEIESGHNFDMTKLIVYYLKLQIAERKTAMNPVQGEEKYKKLYNRITDKIHQSYDGEL